MSATPGSSAPRDPFSGIFISEDGQRLRAGWRLVGQTILMFVMGLCVGIPLIFYLAAAGLIETEISLSSIGWKLLLPLQAGEFLIFTLSVFLARRFLDKRSFTSLGLQLGRPAVKDFLTGLIIAGLIMGVIFALEWFLGWINITGFAWETEPAPAVFAGTLAFLVIFVLTGWNEELLFRGYHLQTVASGLNLSWGVLISSLVFSLAHLGNPGAAWSSVVGILLAGLLLAYAYRRSGQLWLPIGLHFGWNFFEGVVFGFPVSGLEIYKLIHIETGGPAVWTGGAFGPEAGLIVIPGLLLGTALISYYTRTRRS